MRYVPIVEAGTGYTGWGLRLLTGFGLISILVAAAFILFQHDLKRLLAYHSVEHIGIITLGVGLGGLGTFAALFHTLNHSLCKTLAFFAAGRLDRCSAPTICESWRVRCAWRRCGGGIVRKFAGVDWRGPLCIIHERTTDSQGGCGQRSHFGSGIVSVRRRGGFVGALGHAIPLAWGKTVSTVRPARAGTLETLLVMVPLVLLLVLGLWIPELLQTSLNAAVDVIRYARPEARRSPGGVMP